MQCGIYSRESGRSVGWLRMKADTLRARLGGGTGSPAKSQLSTNGGWWNPEFLSVGAILTLIALLSTLVDGYGFGYSNQVYQLPWIYKLRNPLLYPNDPFVDSLRWYVTYFVRGMSLVPPQYLQLVYLAVHVLTRIAAVAVFYWAIMPIAKNRTLAMIGCAVFAFSRLTRFTMLTGDDLLGGVVTQTSVAFPLALAAFGFYLRKRLIACCLVCGILMNINMMIACFLAFLCLGASLAGDIAARRVSARRYAISLALFFVAALPALVWCIQYRLAVSGQSIPPVRSLTDGLWCLWPYFWFPASWVARGSAVRSVPCLLALTLVGMRLLDREWWLRVFAFLGSLAVVWILGYVFVVLVPNRSVIMLIPFRTEKWLNVLAVISVVALLQKAHDKCGLHIKLLAVPILVYSVVQPHGPPFLAVLAAFAYLFRTPGCLRPSRSRRHRITTATCTLLCCVCSFSHSPPLRVIAQSRQELTGSGLTFNAGQISTQAPLHSS